MVGRHYNFGRKEAQAAEPDADRVKRLGLALCAADITKHKRAVTISFDSAEDRDRAWLDLHGLRNETQARACR